MSLAATAVSVGTSETTVYTSTNDRTVIRVHNNGTNDVYLGPTGVLTTTGYPVVANAEVELVLQKGEVVYGIVAAGTEDVRVIVASARGGVG